MYYWQDEWYSFEGTYAKDLPEKLKGIFFMDGNQPENLANFGGPSIYTIGTALSLFIGACIAGYDL